MSKTQQSPHVERVHGQIESVQNKIEAKKQEVHQLSQPHRDLADAHAELEALEAQKAHLLLVEQIQEGNREHDQAAFSTLAAQQDLKEAVGKLVPLVHAYVTASRDQNQAHAKNMALFKQNQDIGNSHTHHPGLEAPDGSFVKPQLGQHGSGGFFSHADAINRAEGWLTEAYSAIHVWPEARRREAAAQAQRDAYRAEEQAEAEARLAEAKERAAKLGSRPIPHGVPVGVLAPGKGQPFG